MLCSYLCGEEVGVDVAQFSECHSEWGSNLGVLKARSYF
jgi:hypothetical protein